MVVRITGDDPFKDPEVIDLIVGHLLAHKELDYVSNTIDPTYPEGVDTEAFTFEALERTWREAKLLSEREHVTPYIYKNPEKFAFQNIRHKNDLSHLRWTIDYEEDLRFAREVCSRLDGKSNFTMGDILALLEKEPELANINRGIERNAGYQASLERETEASQN